MDKYSLDGWCEKVNNAVARAEIYEQVKEFIEDLYDEKEDCSESTELLNDFYCFAFSWFLEREIGSRLSSTEVVGEFAELVGAWRKFNDDPFSTEDYQHEFETIERVKRE